MPPTYPQHIDAATQERAISLWKSGQLVAFPTETVYGLGADAMNDEAVARIFAAKARPRFNPLIVHVSSIAIAKRYGVWNDMADALAHAFWAGPLTLVLKKRDGISDLVTAGGDTVGLRIPRHPIALQLLEAFGGGIAAPSANRSGRISPTTAAHVRAEFGDTLPLILDGGSCEVGLESTVVDVSADAPILWRAGGITRSQIEQCLGQGLSSTTHLKGVALASPGQLASHYAPSKPVRLNATHIEVGEGLLSFGAHSMKGGAHEVCLSQAGNLQVAATRLFAALRELDGAPITRIAVMPIPNEGIGEAINDRLQRAAAPKEGE